MSNSILNTGNDRTCNETCIVATVGIGDTGVIGIRTSSWNAGIEESLSGAVGVDCAQCKFSGYTVNGTFAEYMISDVNHVTPIPEDFPSDAAVSILCAGVTVYHTIKYSQTSAGGWIVLLSARGGLGHLAVQYAHARVSAVSASTLVAP
ncbi:uncharacterized protein ARMOST_22137 [Armillaria ostoyae]|uniref:Uncharacterized protein n=1 Tax=Armillaria ostoyae TaxID=47428 RepID=A0A284SC12_ARMOS|nr:uncharacterized protein ARMOST_22137 [Armillaria ostoyae]